MARNDTFIAVPPDRVYELLCDPDSYGHWVVGSRSIRDADPGFPAVGTRFHHTVGVGPVATRDHTRVLAATPGRELVLRARALPFGVAKVTLRLQPEGSGTRMTMVEDPASAVVKVLIGPFGHLAIRLRNVESLRRLKRLAES